MCVCVCVCVCVCFVVVVGGGGGFLSLSFFGFPLLLQDQQENIACTVKQIVAVGRPEVLSQSLPRFMYNLLFTRNIKTASEQNCNGYWSMV